MKTIRFSKCLILGTFLICSCNQFIEHEEKTGEEIWFDVTYNKLINETKTSVSFYNNFVFHAATGTDYTSIRPNEDYHAVNINGSQFNNYNSYYSKIDTGLLYQTTVKINSESETYMNSLFIIDTIGFAQIDTFSISSDDSVFWIGNDLMSNREQVSLELLDELGELKEILGSSSNSVSKAIYVNEPIDYNYARRILTFRIKRTKKPSLQQVNLPSDLGKVSQTYIIDRKIFIDY